MGWKWSSLLNINQFALSKVIWMMFVICLGQENRYLRFLPKFSCYFLLVSILTSQLSFWWIDSCCFHLQLINLLGCGIWKARAVWSCLPITIMVWLYKCQIFIFRAWHVHIRFLTWDLFLAVTCILVFFFLLKVTHGQAWEHNFHTV